MNYRELVRLGALGETIGSITRRQAVEAAFSEMEPRNGTALYEALLAAYEEAKSNFDPHAVNNVVLLTDGHADHHHAHVSPEQLDLETLQNVTDVVGGEAYAADQVDDVTRILLRALTD